MPRAVRVAPGGRPARAAGAEGLSAGLVAPAEAASEWRWSNYKLVLKAYIYEHTAELPDAERLEYFKHKKKEGSLQHRHSSLFAIDDRCVAPLSERDLSAPHNLI
jgi:hypothetical protein